MVFSNVARRLVRTTLVGRNVKVPYIGCSDHGAASRTLCVGAAESKSPASILIAQDRITFIVECSFQHGMPVKLASSILPRHDVASGLLATGVDEEFAPFLRLKGVKDVPIHSCSVPDLLQPHEKDKVILLSPDAPEALQTVEMGCAYIIGGIVDRTPAKYKSMFFAREHGLQTKKLPMDGNVTFEGSGSLNAKWFLLNVEHVVDAMLHFHISGDWTTAFDTALPVRKRRRT